MNHSHCPLPIGYNILFIVMLNLIIVDNSCEATKVSTNGCHHVNRFIIIFIIIIMYKLIKL